MNEYQERIKRMRARYVRKAEVDIERGIYMTQAYQETEGREPAYRQAKALELNLRKKSIGIFDEVQGRQHHSRNQFAVFGGSDG